MSSEVAIEVSNLSKSYKLFSTPGRRFMQPFMRNRELFTSVEVLKDIDLTIYKGETVGIVGANGAGKSTLLSIIAGVLGYDKGEVVVNGRVSALLSLGTGFVPDLTGRENIFMNATMLGMSRKETEDQLENILEFAAIGEYINQPIRTYSSGMYARLAFSVAIHTNPEILIIDETLSVGDEAFQRKCFGRIDELKTQGVTILFVSHSAGSVLELCDRAVMLSGGKRLLTESPRNVLGYYQKLVYAAGDKRKKILKEIERFDSGETINTDNSEEGNVDLNTEILSDRFDQNLKPESTIIYESRGATIKNARFTNKKGQRLNVMQSNGEYYYVYNVKFDTDIVGARFSMLLKTINGLEIGALWTAPRGEGLNVSAGETVTIKFPVKFPLREGTYFSNSGVTGFLDGEYVTLHRIIDACIFKILPQNSGVGDRYVNITATTLPTIEKAI